MSSKKNNEWKGLYNVEKKKKEKKTPRAKRVIYLDEDRRKFKRTICC
jgi:hypothetical protein